METQETTERQRDDTRLQRISLQTRGLFDDIRSWVELRLELAQLEVEDRVEERVNEATSGAVVAVLVLVAVLFLLAAAAIGLGYLFDNIAIGFLIVGGVLLLATLILHRVQPRMVRIGKERSKE